MGKYKDVRLANPRSDEQIDQEMARVNYIINEAAELWGDNPDIVLGRAASTLVDTLMNDDLKIMATHFIVAELGNANP